MTDALTATVLARCPMPNFANVKPVPCEHIADYYNMRWTEHRCLAWQLLRHGYRQWSAGYIVRGVNNLFEESAK